MPIFVKPYFLFFLSWFLSLAFLRLSVTTVSFDGYASVVIIFIISCLSFLFGYLFSRLLGSISGRYVLWTGFMKQGQCLRISPENIYIFLILLCLTLVFFNFYSDGYPPFFRFLGFETKHYNEYGRFIGVLIPVLSSAAIATMFFSRNFFRLLCLLFVYLIFMLYVLRGPMIISLFQVFLIFLIFKYQSSADKIKYYAYYSLFSLLCLAVVVVIFSVVGTHRSGLDSFYEFLRIKDSAKQDYSTLTLWVATYFSVPISNFFWFYSEVGFSEVDLSFLTRLLPAFWVVESEQIFRDVKLLNNYMIDDVHFYLFYWYSGLGISGIFLVNFIYGFFGHFCSKNVVLYSIFGSVIMFSFFIDYLFYFSVLVQVLILLFFGRYLRAKS